MKTYFIRVAILGIAQTISVQASNPDEALSNVINEHAIRCLSTAKTMYNLIREDFERLLGEGMCLDEAKYYFYSDDGWFNHQGYWGTNEFYATINQVYDQIKYDQLVIESYVD